MVDAVVRAVGVTAAASAEIQGDLADLALALELVKAGISLDDRSFALIHGFHADSIEVFVAAELACSVGSAWQEGAATSERQGCRSL